MSDLEDVFEFRNRLVLYMNDVREHISRFSAGPSPEIAARLSSEQSWLGQEYGRLFQIINRWGGTQMAMPALGVTSHDVVGDAIHSPRDVYYNDICANAVRHLDTVIGRLRGEAEARAARGIVAPDTLYRVTSPVYWLQRFGVLLHWVLGTALGRGVAIVSAIVLAIITGLATGAGQAFVENILSGPSPVP